MARIELVNVESAELASEGTSADVLFNLGLMYCIGREVEQDMVEAHKWFNLAATRGSEVAREYRKEISMEMSAEQISRAQKEARAWLTVH